MDRRTGMKILMLAATLLGMINTGALAFDDSKYPDLSGEWHGTGNRWPTNPPLTPEYQAI